MLFVPPTKPPNALKDVVLRKMELLPEKVLWLASSPHSETGRAEQSLLIGRPKTLFKPDADNSPFQFISLRTHFKPRVCMMIVQARESGNAMCSDPLIPH